MFRNSARSVLRLATTQRRIFSSANESKFKSQPATKVGLALTSVFFFLLITNDKKTSENAGLFGFGSTVPNVPAIKKDIVAAIEAEDAKRSDGTSIAPTLIRLAWHASGTYSIFDKTGGSNGATMRFAPESNWGANAGLKSARDLLEKIKSKHNLSYADLWTLAGAVAVEHMGGPVVVWRAGRKDAAAGTEVPDGRLPGANLGCPKATMSHVRDIFGRMGFNDQEIVALLGAHAVGRCHTDASGFWGPWTNAETTFSNEYFRVLLEEKWTEKKTHEGKPWTGPKQYENKDGTLMMLPADLWLLEDKAFREWVQIYAADETRFFIDFSAAFEKLLELGVNFEQKK